MNRSTISSLLTPLLRAIRSCPRRGSRVPSAAAMATETRARLRSSSALRAQESPNFVHGGQPAEVCARGGLGRRERQYERVTQQSLGDGERLLVMILVVHQDPPHVHGGGITGNE